MNACIRHPVSAQAVVERLGERRRPAEIKVVIVEPQEAGEQRHVDPARGLIKPNPLADWTRDLVQNALIAGIVLTVGTAVDANILINERIREEVKAGRSPIQALEAGFTKASGTILDSNVTNLLAMAALYIFGSGPVKGFAVTVALGTFVHLFTATTLVRLMISVWFRSRRPRSLPV